MTKRRSRVIADDDEDDTAKKSFETPVRDYPSMAFRVGRQNDSQGPSQLGAPNEHAESDESPPRKRPRKDSQQTAANGRASKGKARASTTQHAVTAGSSQVSQLGPDEEPGPDEELFVRKRHSDGYLPGSIVRLAAKNFMTYDDVTFLFGAHLNMIIGPNGTGKSSLICAIALGLGYGPAVLERANELKYFVKQGTDEGFVEVELKGHPNKRNVTIKVHLALKSNSRVFELNGSRATLKEVQEIVHSFNIQVDNLCCFLPQEKVVKFSAMNPVTLLQATQKAAGHPRLTYWHSQLIEEGKKRIAEKDILENLQQDSQIHEKRLQKMQKDVDLWKKRRAHEIQIKVLELAARQCSYRSLKREHDRVKEQVAELQKTVDAARLASEPMTLQVDTFDRINKMNVRLRKTLDETLTKLNSSITRAHKNCEAAQRTIEGAASELENLKDTERSRNERISKLRTEVELLTAQVAVPVEAPNTSGILDELKDLTARGRTVQEDVTMNHDRLMGVYNQQKKIADTKDQIHDELARLNNASFRKESSLSADRRTANLPEALRVLRQLKEEGRFHEEVYEPIRLVITAKELRFAHAVESCIAFNKFNTFVCTNEHDYNVLGTELNDVRKLRVNIAQLPEGDKLANYQSPMPRERLHELGFDHFIIDLIDGPEAALSFLCLMHRLHEIPVAHSSQAKIDQAFLDQKSCPFSLWIVGDTRFGVSYSSYGQRSKIISSGGLGKPSILTMGTVDQLAIDNKNKELQAILSAEAEKKAMYEELRASDLALRAELEQIQAHKEQLAEDRKAAAAPHLEYQKRVKRKDVKAKELAKEEAQPSTHERKARLEKKLEEASRAYMIKAIEFQVACCKRPRLTTVLHTWQLRSHLNQNDAQCFANVFENSNQELKKLEEQLKQTREMQQRMKAGARKMMEELRDTVGRSAPEVSDRLFAAMEQRTPEGYPLTEEMFRALLAAEQDALQLTAPVDHEVEKNFAELDKQVQNLYRDIDSHKSLLARYERKIADLLALWKPRLDELINRVDQKFDATFREMGCLAHVYLTEDEDFSKWGIEIKISFRDGVPMSLLTEQTQSGGERSLATIMFLMSLTEITKTPFCAVDEINQGLDMRAERQVHNRVVASTCKEGASQYFLITPKLLLGLEYHPRMRVLCINNGHWLPLDFKIGDFLSKAKRRTIKARKS